MLVWNNLKRYSIYRKLLISYLILILLSIMLISTLLYQKFSYQAENEMKQMSMSAIHQMQNAANVLHEQIYSIGYELLHDRDMMTLMNSTVPDMLLENEVALNLNSIQGIYSFIKYIAIYNGNTGRYVNNKGITPEIDADVIALLNDNEKNHHLSFVPRMFRTDQLLPHRRPEPVLTLILYSNLSNVSSQNGAVVITVDQSILIGDKRHAPRPLEEEWMVANENGIVISHGNPQHFLTMLHHTPQYKRILDSDSSEGFFTTTFEGKKHLVVYAKSAETNWVTIGSRPYPPRFLIFDHFTTKGIFVALFALMGVIIAFSLAGKMYRPYSLFESQRKKLESSLQHAVPALQESYFRKLLSGSAQISPSYADIFQWDANFKKSPFLVIVIKIDEFKAFSARPSKEQEVIRFAIMNIAEELLVSHQTYASIEMENDAVVVIAQLERPVMPNRFPLLLTNLQHIVHQYFKITVSIGIGDIAHTYKDIRLSYRSAKEYLKYRLFLGHGSLIDRIRIENQLTSTSDYPTKNEMSLLEAINLGNKHEIDREVQCFIEKIKNLNYKQAFIYTIQLVAAIQKKDNFQPFENEEEAHGALLYSLADLETLGDVRSALLHYCHSIVERAEEKRNHRNFELIENVRQLIHDNYHHPFFSLEWVADQVHYSSGYLSKVFKQVTHQSFNDYVNTFRLKEATHLLKTTNDSAAVISEKVGIGSSTYFFTLFKKTYGMTPAQFRSK